MPWAKIFFLCCLFQTLIAKEIVYLSWQESPDSTMIVHRLIDAPERPPFFYRKEGEERWRQLQFEEADRPDFLPYHIQSVFLSGLEQDSRYEMQFGKCPSLFFRTAPKELNGKVRIAFGGDHYHQAMEDVSAMNKAIAAFSPLAVVLGGDLAYSYLHSYQAKEDKMRWVAWLELWSKTMVTKEGTMIPMIAAIGNHDVGLPFYIPFRAAPLFFDLFTIDNRKSFRKIGFGNWLALYILDTGHAQSITGPQLNWLSKEAKYSLNPFRYKIAVYHVPAWPSHRSVDGALTSKVRKNWVPLFEKMGLAFAFENHDHLYKRTFPMIEGHREEKGVTYIGSGGWGGANHKPHPERPYLAKTMAVQNGILCQFSWNEILLQSISVEGKIIDEVSRPY